MLPTHRIEKALWAYLITMVILVSFSVIGWITNVVFLITGNYATDAEFALGIIGVLIAPFGAIFGWVHLF